MQYQHWTAKMMPDLAGKTALVTGANSGLGLVAARELARKGACVLMACRSPERGQAALQEVCAAAPQATVELLPLDLGDLASVRACAQTVAQRFDKLDILMNNAGVMGIPRRQTADGFEMQFGVNHLGHFALTGLLLARLEAAPQARVVTVSSMMHLFGKMDFDDPMGEKAYDPWRAYSQSKLANLLFAYELQRRLEERRSPVASLGAHPGYSATHLQFVSGEMKSSRLELWGNKVANTLLAQSADMGALPQLYAATAPEAQGGMYIGPGGLNGVRGYPKVVKSNQRSYDRAAAARLWELSERLTGVCLDG